MAFARFLRLFFSYFTYTLCSFLCSSLFGSDTDIKRIIVETKDRQKKEQHTALILTRAGKQETSSHEEACSFYAVRSNAGSYDLDIDLIITDIDEFLIIINFVQT